MYISARFRQSTFADARFEQDIQDILDAIEFPN
jgi:hypothetical protein